MKFLRIIPLTLALVSSSLLISSCATSPTAQVLAHVSVGMTKQQVFATLGVPAETAVIGQREYLGYFLKPHTNSTTLTKYYIVLRNNQVVEWGHHSKVKMKSSSESVNDSQHGTPTSSPSPIRKNIRVE